MEVQNNRTDNETNSKLAKLAGVGVGTVARYNKVMNSDDEDLKILLKTNIRRRGEIGGSAKKVGKRIKELERLYGIENGNNQHNRVTNNFKPSQDDLAKEIGISVDTLQNYKKLTELVPELQDWVETGISLYSAL